MEQEEPIIKCKKCEETFSSKEEAKVHLALVHTSDDKPFSCSSCTKSFKNRYQLVLHTRTHTGEKPFQCSICKRSFSMSSNLQKHLDTHSLDKTYRCVSYSKFCFSIHFNFYLLQSYCDQYFKTQRSLKFHTVCHHQPEIKVKCPQCDKSFVNKSYLKVHMLYHTGKKSYENSI